MTKTQKSWMYLTLLIFGLPIFVVFLEQFLSRGEVHILILVAGCYAVWALTSRHYKTKEQIRKLRKGTWVVFLRDSSFKFADKKISVPKGTLGILMENFKPDYGMSVWFEKPFADKGNPVSTCHREFEDPWLFSLAAPPADVQKATIAEMDKWEREVAAEFLRWGITPEFVYAQKLLSRYS